jgi:HAMP domain-containing protein
MDTWVWIVIAIGAVLLVFILVLAARRANERRIETKRVEARELRHEAKARSTRAEEREALAEEQAEQARQERMRAEEVSQRASRVDPDID